MPHLPPLLEETLAAGCAMAVLGAIVALLYRAITRQPLWPGVVLGELAGLGFGTALLALASPRRRR